MVAIQAHGTALWVHSRESYPPRQLPVCFDILSQGLPLVPLVLDVSLQLQKSLPGSFAQAFAKVPPSSSLSLQSPWQCGCTSGFSLCSAVLGVFCFPSRSTTTFLFPKTNRKLEGQRAEWLQPMRGTGKEIRGWGRGEKAWVFLSSSLPS